MRVIADAHDELVTKHDLQSALAPIKAELAVIKWMMGFLLAGETALIINAFFA